MRHDRRVRIRRHRDEDVPQIGEVHATSRHAAYAGLVAREALARVTPQTQADAWRRRLSDMTSPWSMLVVEHPDDRRVAGFVLGSGSGPLATLHAIHVLPELHGSGAGQLLHDHMVAAFRAWRCTRAQLWVLEGNARAQAFYRRNGWALDGGRDSNDIGGALVPIVRYRLSLDQEIASL
jgi:ribosomal protein S18 acetylase RimI-like enzyme